MRKAVLCAIGLCLDAAVSHAFGQTTWIHNGSSMTLIASGQSRTFIYENPRAGMREVGVSPGTVLFKGVRNGNKYSGTAYVFSKRCGALPYPVSGDVSADDREVDLRGTAPQVDANCRVVNGRSDALTFTLLEPDVPVLAKDTEFSAQAAAPTPDLHAALAQEQSAHRRTVEQLRLAQLETAAAEDRARRAETLANSAADVTGSISRFDTPRANPVNQYGAAGPAILVMLISLLIELFKLLTKKGVGLGREVALGTIASFASSYALAMAGYSNEIKVLVVPLLGGLFSLSVLLSVKQLAGHQHGTDPSTA